MPFIPCVPSSSRFLTFARHLVLAVFAVVAGATLALAQTPPAPGGPVEGIKVHGHWTIDIRNADGTLASHHEFENALSNYGQPVLPPLLRGTMVAGAWSVTIAGSGIDTTWEVCDDGGTTKVPCMIREPLAEPWIYPNAESTNLVVSSPGPNTLRLQGSVRSSPISGSEVRFVQTELRPCATNTLPCTAVQIGSSGAFTTHSFNGVSSLPIPVAAGQIIQVTVDITFS